MEYKETPYRWVILGLYSLGSACSGMVWIAESSITSEISSVI
jgi:hypothetical protein